MTPREEYMRGTLALALTELVPTILRKALIEDEALSAQWGLVTDGSVTFGPKGVSFRRSLVLQAVRDASRPDNASIAIQDEAGNPWTLDFDRSLPAPVVTIKSRSQTIRVRHLAMLSEQLSDRQLLLETEAARVNLSAEAKARWRDVIQARGLNDSEVTDLAQDLNNTPSEVASAISASLSQESAHFDLLVPRNGTYYERLIGPFRNEPDIRAYVENLPSFLDEVEAYDTERGMRLALLLSSHPIVIDKLAERNISPEVFDRLVQWASDEADVMTRCALLELAVIRQDVLEETRAKLAAMATGLIVGEDGVDEGFEMLSGAFIFVYGQISHLKVHADRPSYWRRMAALAQAALISRCMAPKQGALVEFAENLREARTRPYALQVYADMRLGPLWQGQFAALPQLRNEFVGRVLTRALAHENTTRALGLYDIILGETNSLRATVNPFFMYTAGPLEDNIPLVRELDGDNLAAVEAGLAAAKPTTRSFAPLVNSVFLFRQKPELAEKAAEALQRAQYRLEGDSKEIVVAALVGLATCAAITRSIALADAIFTVIRSYRKFSPQELSISEAIRIGSIACASRDDLPGWAAAIGGLMSDFAFQTLQKDEAAALDTYMRDMCDMFPELWAACSQALAATEAVAA